MAILASHAQWLVQAVLAVTFRSRKGLQLLLIVHSQVAGEVRGYIKSEVLAIVSDGHAAEVPSTLNPKP